MTTRRQAAQGGNMRPEIKRGARRHERQPYAHINLPGWHDCRIPPQISDGDSHPEMGCTLTLAGQTPQCQGSVSTQEPGNEYSLPGEDSRTPRIYMMSDNEIPQKAVTWGDRLNHGLELAKVRSRTLFRVPLTLQETMSLGRLQSSAPVSTDYELWRMYKDGDDWTYAFGKRLPESQEELAKKAKKNSENGTVLKQAQRMGPQRLARVEELINERNKQTGLRWELAWMQDVITDIISENNNSVRIFDIIIAPVESEILRRSSNNVLSCREIIIVPAKRRDSPSEILNSRSRLSPLGQRFVNIKTGNYERCLEFLLLNPAAIDEDHLQYLTEARLALDREDEELAESCVGKSMYVRDCKVRRTQKYFDTLMRSQEKRHIFNNDLETALALLKQPSRQTAATEKGTSSARANTSRQLVSKLSADSIPDRKAPEVEDDELVPQQQATKAVSDVSGKEMPSQSEAQSLRFRASSWPRSRGECYTSNHAGEDIQPDLLYSGLESEEENEPTNLETGIYSTDRQESLLQEIEGYQIQQRELLIAEEKVRAREDEFAIDKAKIDEIKEQQRQVATQLRKDKEEFSKAQHVQFQIFEDHQRNLEKLADRLQEALAKAQDKKRHESTSQPQLSQFVGFEKNEGFGIINSRIIFERICAWHKHRHALLP